MSITKLPRVEIDSRALRRVRRFLIGSTVGRCFENTRRAIHPIGCRLTEKVTSRVKNVLTESAVCVHYFRYGKNACGGRVERRRG